MPNRRLGLTSKRCEHSITNQKSVCDEDSNTLASSIVAQEGVISCNWLSANHRQGSCVRENLCSYEKPKVRLSSQVTFQLPSENVINSKFTG